MKTLDLIYYDIPPPTCSPTASPGMIILIAMNWHSRSRPKSRMKLTSSVDCSLPSRMAPLLSLNHAERLRSAMDAVSDLRTESTTHVSHRAVKCAHALE